MNIRLILCTTLLAAVFLPACKKNDPEPSYPLGINYSEYLMAKNAVGSIDQQNSGPKKTYTVDYAYVKPIPNAQYRFMMHFTSQDSLQVIFAKATADYNYHYPKPVQENQLLYVVLNKDTLALKDAALSLQPRPNDNNFYTVSNLHTLKAGDFNGTVEKVPLLVP